MCCHKHVKNSSIQRVSETPNSPQKKRASNWKCKVNESTNVFSWDRLCLIQIQNEAWRWLLLEQIRNSHAERVQLLVSCRPQLFGVICKTWSPLCRTSNFLEVSNSCALKVQTSFQAISYEHFQPESTPLWQCLFFRKLLETTIAN